MQWLPFKNTLRVHHLVQSSPDVATVAVFAPQVEELDTQSLAKGLCPLPAAPLCRPAPLSSAFPVQMSLEGPQGTSLRVTGRVLTCPSTTGNIMFKDCLSTVVDFNFKR